MEENNLSPFSSSGSSISPKYYKHHSPHTKEEKDQKKAKAKSALVLERPFEKKKPDPAKKEMKGKPKMTKE
jgi:hypothetical protein